MHSFSCLLRNYSICKLAAVGALLVLSSGAALAQKDKDPIQLPARVSTSVKRITGPITLDGKLDEPSWRDAPVITLVQQAPHPGGKTPYVTQVRVLVSDDAIYFGFTCRDPEPNAIAIHTMRRDGDMTGDDTVSIVLDTYGDHRTGYFFQINAAATRVDGLISTPERLTGLGRHLGCPRSQNARRVVGGDCRPNSDVELHSRPERVGVEH